jgi:methylamine dehydrogenase accessory protein MauD
METFLLVSNLALWPLVLFLAFLLLGTLRAHGVLRWQLEQLEATTPNRVGRSGLKPGKSAPEFTLPSVAGGDVSLRDFAGRPVLLVFVQVGCGPCHAIAPELNRLARQGDVQVVVVNNGDPEAVREWAVDVGAEFPVLVQERWKVSRSYEVYATPFAYLIDGGVVRSAGIASSREYLGYVLSGAGSHPGPEHAESGRTASEKSRSEEPVSTKEVSGV